MVRKKKSQDMALVLIRNSDGPTPRLWESSLGSLFMHLNTGIKPRGAHKPNLSPVIVAGCLSLIWSFRAEYFGAVSAKAFSR